jgi:hypothetical protein
MKYSIDRISKNYHMYALFVNLSIRRFVGLCIGDVFFYSENLKLKADLFVQLDGFVDIFLEIYFD